MVEKERRAPVQGYSAGIPWSMHLRAYDVYSKKYAPQQALIEGSCRGGFGTEELDAFIPGWREELSELTYLRGMVQHLTINLVTTARCLPRDNPRRLKVLQWLVDNNMMPWVYRDEESKADDPPRTQAKPPPRPHQA